LPPENDDRIEVLRECIEVAPFDEAAHIELVRTLLRRALYVEAEHQIDATVTLFQSEGIDPTSLKSAFAAAQRSVSKPAGMSLVDHLDAPCGQQAVRTRGPTILMMPFAAATPEGVADADSITCDIIFGIAKLRSISIIARGTAFSLRSQTPAAAAALVNAQYVASGHLRRDGKRYLVSVELTDPKSGRIFWADEFSCNAVDSFSAPGYRSRIFKTHSCCKRASVNARLLWHLRLLDKHWRPILVTRQHIARSVERNGSRTATMAPSATSINPFV